MATETVQTHTPTPWRRGKASDAIVADAPLRPFDSPEDVAYYGGYLIAESVTVANQDFIVRACNVHEELLEALRELVRQDACQRATQATDIGLAMAVDRAWTAIAHAEGR